MVTLVMMMILMMMMMMMMIEDCSHELLNIHYLSLGADVLDQLSRMRQQLQTERKRVESDLKKEQVHVNVLRK